ncbi:MAG: helix-hairpin-helix domain-containing protein [bacterium]|nr:helix-hairpin-helix domain-containing protein [bacterium]
MRNKQAFFLLILFSFCSPVFAFTFTNWNEQETNSEEDIYRFYQEGSIGYFDYLRLLDIWENKIDINRAEIEDLLDLPGVDTRIAEAIVEYRDKTGLFEKISDLENVPLLTRDTYKYLRNFVEVFPSQKGGSLRVKLEEDPLDDEGFYIYHRLQYQTSLFGFGYLLERDQEIEGYSIENGTPKKAEEENKFRLKKKYILFRDCYGIKDIIIGNYTLRFGKGLVIGNSDRKNKIGSLPDLSLYDKFFGITGKLKINRVTLTPFISKDTLNNNAFPDVYREEVKGLNTRFDITKYFSMGGTYYRSEINKDFDFDLSAYPDAAKAEVYGIDFSYRYGFLKFSGETAKVKAKGRGSYLELSYDLKEIFSLISFRDFAPNFYNPHSQSFAQEDDEPNDRDERGFYFEEYFKFSRKFSLRTSFDQWSHPGRKITDRELGGQADCYPVSFFNLSASRRIKDEDMYKTGDKKIKDYLNGRFLLGKKIELAVFYGKDRASNSDIEDIIDNFWGYQVKLDNDRNIFLIRTKLSDDNTDIAGDKKKEYFFYAKLKEIRQIAIGFSFKAVHSSEEVSPNTQELYRFSCDYIW